MTLRGFTTDQPLILSNDEASDAHLSSLVEAWRAQYDDCSVHRPPAETDAAYERLWAIEQALVAVRPTTVEGDAAEILILTSFGEFDLFDSLNKEALLAEAQEVAAIAPPRYVIEQGDAIAAREALEQQEG